VLNTDDEVADCVGSIVSVGEIRRLGESGEGVNVETFCGTDSFFGRYILIFNPIKHPTPSVLINVMINDRYDNVIPGRGD